MNFRKLTGGIGALKEVAEGARTRDNVAKNLGKLVLFLNMHIIIINIIKALANQVFLKRLESLELYQYFAILLMIRVEKIVKMPDFETKNAQDEFPT